MATDGPTSTRSEEADDDRHQVNDRNARTKPVRATIGTESRTKQAFTKECDINLIVKRHAQRGMWDHLNPRQPTYGDFTGAQDLHEATELVKAATENFMELPAEVRKLANHDPVELLRALADREKTMELENAGLPIEETTTPVVEDTPTE